MSHQSTPNDNVFNLNTKNCKVYDFLVNLDKAKDPEVWPLRVGVRHYRAPP